jgi:hypothetical protein
MPRNERFQQPHQARVHIIVVVGNSQDDNLLKPDRTTETNAIFARLFTPPTPLLSSAFSSGCHSEDASIRHEK